MDINKRYEKLSEEFNSMTPKGLELYNVAKRFLPGGETRSAVNMYPHPMYIESAQGTIIRDVDGNEFKDFINNYTSMIHGHCHPEIEEKVIAAMKKGSGITAVLPEQVELSKALCERVPGVDMVRFCNSGTEATMFAVRAARAITGKDKVIKMEGGYHGTYDSFEYNFAPPLLENGQLYHSKPIPDSGGIPYKVGEDVIFAPFNNLEIIEKELKDHNEEIACVIVEPLLGSAGFIVPNEGYLKGLRELTKKYNTLLIFDEVQSLRLSDGGVQKIEGIIPDLTAMGKIIGGGLPVGAVGGPKEIMNAFSGGFEAKLTHSGTFNGARPVMAGGLQSIKMFDQKAADRINAMGDRLAVGITSAIDKYAIPASVSHWGSLLHVHFVEKRPTNYQESVSPNKMYNKFFHLAMVNRGLYVAPRGSWALSTVMTDEDIDFAIKVVNEVFTEMKMYV